MATRPYLSIGEVLTLLKGEFPDVTISKIRFLESQGLLDPERTPSGYRKFYAADIDRLRWILRQQRENFLPLKVIRGRLASDTVPADPPALAGAEAEAAPRTGAGARPLRPPGRGGRGRHRLVRRAGGRGGRPGRRVPPLRRGGPPPAHVQAGGGAGGRLLRAGRHASPQAAQPRGPPAG